MINSGRDPGMQPGQRPGWEPLITSAETKVHAGVMSRHRFHGDPTRFEVVAAFVADRFPAAHYVADVAGGQGMLARVLSKRYNLACEVVDPRGWTLRGVSARQEAYAADMADHYDLIIGLHPDEALRPVVESAAVRPVLVLPCCNFWSDSQRLSQDALLAAIRAHHEALGGTADPVSLAFRGPKNVGLVLDPPPAAPAPATVEETGPHSAG
jgi:hypothetical protein